ncbi:uncharacterized protein LOC129800520 isoform X2 [Phlebotomus papatasi]|uniref:uncharacterized protein LOC129800520 isoform X2 n=1 Tax=Phlebotomus papatasi TaxID=29031 RepID=UPI00248431C3|nr:uncharacterized protein LOC129800520 isoform X2 [Phlebotomus papatasi]XP_055700979.1 uncharacterized protein LOC129800520 isoform X2 [Phlebotomus papatasi]
MDNQESISSARSLPQWMRTKMDNRLDATDIPFSPPTHDESFFYVRYPAGERKRQEDLSHIRNALEDGGVSSLAKTRDFSKHTDQCKMFLKRAKINTTGVPAKPVGTDDGFKGAGAACGSSIVKMAQAMVSTRPFTRGFTVANFEEASPDTDFPMINPEEDFEIANSKKNMMRRGSKSLPASPMGSPKTGRKIHQNPYFTTNQTTLVIGDQKKWNLSDFLGLQRRTTALSTQSVASQIDENAEEALELDSKFVNLDHDRAVEANQGKTTEAPTVLKAKPSELREMNFWSPTSM